MSLKNEIRKIQDKVFERKLKSPIIKVNGKGYQRYNVDIPKQIIELAQMMNLKVIELNMMIDLDENKVAIQLQNAVLQNINQT